MFPGGEEQNVTTMQMELNYDSDPRAQEREGGREGGREGEERGSEREEKKKWMLVPLFSTPLLWSLGTSAAWPGSEKYPEL